MIDNRLARADATKRQLHEIMMAQENSERLCDIGMKINIGHGAAAGICDAVKALTDGKKGAHGPTGYFDTAECGQSRKYLLYKASSMRSNGSLSPSLTVNHATPRTPKRSRRILRGVDCVAASAAELSTTCANTPITPTRGKPYFAVIVQTALSVNAFSDTTPL